MSQFFSESIFLVRLNLLKENISSMTQVNIRSKSHSLTNRIEFEIRVFIVFFIDDTIFLSTMKSNEGEITFSVL